MGSGRSSYRENRITDVSADARQRATAARSHGEGLLQRGRVGGGAVAHRLGWSPQEAAVSPVVTAPGRGSGDAVALPFLAAHAP